MKRSGPLSSPVSLLLLILLALTLGGTREALGQTPPFEQVESRFDFRVTLKKLEAAAKQNKIGLVTRASATRGAASIGVKIPGNQVWGLFAPRFAVRMLTASVAAGFEAPVRLYIVEAPDGKVSLRYRKPSQVFKPYRNAELDAMALELDGIFARVTGALR